MIEVVVDQQTGQNDDVVALDPTGVEDDIQHDNHSAGPEGHGQVKQVVQRCALRSGDPVDDWAGDRAMLLPQAVQVPGQPEILDRVPDVHALESYVEIVRC